VAGNGGRFVVRVNSLFHLTDLSIMHSLT
jgi:hypothetical protein